MPLFKHFHWNICDISSYKLAMLFVVTRNFVNGIDITLNMGQQYILAFLVIQAAGTVLCITKRLLFVITCIRFCVPKHGVFP